MAGEAILRIALIFDRLGPYHVARLNGSAVVQPTIGIEIGGESAEYAWSRVAGPTVFERETLFPECSSEQLSVSTIRERLGDCLSEARPVAVAIPGWASKAALLALLWCHRNEVPAILMSESTSIDERRRPAKEWIKRQVIRSFSAALVGGAPHRGYLAQLGFPPDRIWEGYDAVDNPHFAKPGSGEQGAASREQAPCSEAAVTPARSSQLPAPSSPAPYFLASARFIEKKNLPFLLRAYARYRELILSCRGPVVLWCLTILGDGPLRPALSSQLDALGLHGSVAIPGFKQYDELPAWYHGAGAFVHASSTEQWGLVVNEAAAAGLPLLVSNRCGCAQDLVQEGVNGFTFDPHNLEQLAQLMLKISSMECGDSSLSSAPAGSAASSQSTDPKPSTLNPQPSTTLAQMGDASRKIVAAWGPDRFASGLKAAVDKALEAGPIQPTLLQSAILQLLLRR